MLRSWGPLRAILAIVATILVSQAALGQASLTRIQKIAHSVDQKPVPILLKDSGEAASDQTDEDDSHSKFRTRQALILTGVAVSMLAYGYFVLQYNNSRTDSEQARLAYEADVRQNAQEYVDQGVALDEIPSFYVWEGAYNDAANDRELAAVAGLSAFLLSLAAVLDSATSGNDRTSDSRARSMTPVLDVSPRTGDIRLGARIDL
jgi:hypothetical protein